MNKLFAFENRTCNFDMISKDFRYTLNPQWYYENGELTYNFDIGFLEDNDSDFTNFYLFLLEHNIPHIGIPRYAKSKQHRLLTDYKIKTPDTYYYSGEYCQNKMISILDNFDGEESVVVKMTTGARGLGTTILKKKNIQKYVNDVESVKNETTSLDKAPLNIEANPENNDTTKDALIRNQVIFQKKVNPIEEFRVFYTFGNDPLVYSRGYNSESFGNASISKEETPLLETLDINEFKFINKFAESLNSPYLSFDLYRDSDGKLGVFEFQQEFGHQYINNHNKLMQNMKSGVLNIVEHKGY